MLNHKALIAAGLALVALLIAPTLAEAAPLERGGWSGSGDTLVATRSGQAPGVIGDAQRTQGAQSREARRAQRERLNRGGEASPRAGARGDQARRKQARAKARARAREKARAKARRKGERKKARRRGERKKQRGGHKQRCKKRGGRGRGAAPQNNMAFGSAVS